MEKVKLVPPGHVVDLNTIFSMNMIKAPLRSIVIFGQTIMALILAASVALSEEH